MRAYYSLTVIDNAGNTKAGASATIRKRSDNSLATVFAAETGAGTAANPVVSDANGRVGAWLDRGAYSVAVTGSGITGFTDYFDAGPASDGAVDGPWLAASALPIATVAAFAGAADPAAGAWVICDGRAISRTTYASLFALIGTTFGTGDGSTTFNLPDLRGRVALGVGTANPAVNGGTAHTLGQRGGEETHLLTAAESGLPLHSHPLVRSVYGGGVAGATSVYMTDSRSDFATPESTGNAGGGNAASPHNTLPPYTGLNYVIRIA